MKGYIVDLGLEYRIQIRLDIDQKPKKKGKRGGVPRGPLLDPCVFLLFSFFLTQNP